jgi:hypothetical protein
VKSVNMTRGWDSGKPAGVLQYSGVSGARQSAAGFVVGE